MSEPCFQCLAQWYRFDHLNRSNKIDPLVSFKHDKVDGNKVRSTD